MDVPRIEYLNRLAFIRQVMKEKELDALLVYSWKRGHVRYLSGYAPNYIANIAILLITQRADPTLFIRFPFDLVRANCACCIDDIRVFSSVTTMGHDVAACLRELHLDHAHIGLAGSDGIVDELPYSLCLQLANELPSATFRDAHNILVDMRMIKNPAEFALLQHSAKVADAAVAIVENILVPGVSEFEIIAAVESAARRLGAEDCLVTVATASTKGHIHPPEDKVMEAGMMIGLETAVQVGGYWSQLARTFVVGKPTGEQKALYELIYHAYCRAAETIRPGKAIGEIAQAANVVLKTKRGNGTMPGDIGHGIGLDLPEMPSIEPEASLPIQVGMVLVVHPSWWDPSIEGTAFIGGTILVTADETLLLHNIPESLK